MKITMRTICFVTMAALLLTATAARAQEKISIGIKGGMTVPNITPGGVKTPLSEGYSSRMAWGVGMFTEFHFTKTVSLQVGLEYSGQGGKKDGVQAMPASDVLAGVKAGMIAQMGAEQAALVEQMVGGAASLLPSGYYYADFKGTVKFNYLMLPVQVKFGWNLSPSSPVRIYAGAGLFGSCLMSAKRVSKGSSPFYADKNRTTMMNYAVSNNGQIINSMPEPGKSITMGVIAGLDESRNMNNTQDITNEIRPMNFGFIGSVGVSYEVAPKHNIFIEGGGNYGFIKIQKSDVNGQNRIGAGSVMVGYSYTL